MISSRKSSASRPRPLARCFALAIAGLAMHTVLGGCNAILDNKPGQLDDRTVELEVTPAPTGSAEPIATINHQTNDGDTATCAVDQHLCNGVCVSLADPAHGCGDASCSPCVVAHGTATCNGRACAVKTCDSGHADCNQSSADGCETDLSLASSCGRCNGLCPPQAPVCSPAKASFGCATGCSATAPLLCGTECVSPLTSTNHCGGCNLKCPGVSQATVACVAGQCKATCKATFHACGVACVPATDPTACGGTCAVCPVAPNATATCQANACALVCKAGFGNCNALAADGCEAAFATDPLNCGACGKSCKGGACVNGLCLPKVGDAG